MPRTTKYTRERLLPLVASVTSMRQLLEALGLKCTGGNYRNIGQKLTAYDISTIHWTGQGWSRGETKETSETVRRIARKNSIPDSEIFIVGSTYPTSRLGYRLRQSGRPYVCENCGVSDEWQGGKLTLHVDHINGILSDATKENLRFLCPNCHQKLTSRFAQSSQPRPSRSEQRLAMRQERQRLPQGICQVCGQEFEPKSRSQKLCSYECSHRASHRTEHPSKEELLALITTLPTTQVAAQFGVSDNAVKKWAVGYGIWDQRINQRPRSRQ